MQSKISNISENNRSLLANPVVALAASYKTTSVAIKEARLLRCVLAIARFPKYLEKSTTY